MTQLSRGNNSHQVTSLLTFENSAQSIFNRTTWEAQLPGDSAAYLNLETNQHQVKPKNETRRLKLCEISATGRKNKYQHTDNGSLWEYQEQQSHFWCLCWRKNLTNSHLFLLTNALILGVLCPPILLFQKLNDKSLYHYFPNLEK